MSNPAISLVTVTDTPTLLFAGCGKVQLERVTPNNSTVSVGGSGVTYGSTGSQWRNLTTAEFKETFEADAEIYGVSNTGTSQVVRVTVWF